jgi:hypothetical protein
MIVKILVLQKLLSFSNSSSSSCTSYTTPISTSAVISTLGQKWKVQAASILHIYSNSQPYSFEFNTVWH